MIQRMQVGFIFIMMHFSIGFFFYPNLIYQSTNKGHWEVILCQCLLQLIFILIYVKGLNFLPQKDIVDIYLKIGRWAAFLVLIPLIIHLTAAVALNIRAHTEVLVSVLLSRTPNWAVMVLLFFISTYTAVKGLRTILRSSIFLFFIFVPFIIFVTISSMMNFDIHNASPSWHSSLDFLSNKHFLYSLGFSSFLFLGVMASDTSVRSRQIFWAWACVTLFFLITVYKPLFIFGQETVVTLPLPYISVTDSIDIRWFVFNRAAMFLAISIVAFTILFNAVILWMIGHVSQKMISWEKGKASYWIIFFSLVAFIMALCIPNWSWIEKLWMWHTVVQLCFMVIIPATIFLIGVLTRKNVMAHEKS